MNRSALTLSVLIGCAALVGNALAGNSQLSNAQGSSKINNSTNTERQRRAELAYTIVKKWGAHVQEAYKVSPGQWAKEMIPLFRVSSMDAMQRAANERSFDAMNDVLLVGNSKSANKLVTTKLLGSTTDDLVFVPVTPCRIFDTRLVGGAITSGTTRDLDITSVTDYSVQGGAAGDCGGIGAVSFAAAAINLTVVSPAGQGFITAHPYLVTRPLAASMVYVGGDLLSNLSIVRLDQTAAIPELSVYASNTTHLVGDIVGYYAAPQATALGCTTVSSAATNVAAGAYMSLPVINCPATYTPTALSISAGENVLVADSYTAGQAGQIFVRSLSANAQAVTAKMNCCRVPGR